MDALGVAGGSLCEGLLGAEGRVRAVRVSLLEGGGVLSAEEVLSDWYGGSDGLRGGVLGVREVPNSKLETSSKL
jgi:hypothetical protein